MVGKVEASPRENFLQLVSGQVRASPMRAMEGEGGASLMENLLMGEVLGSALELCRGVEWRRREDTAWKGSWGQQILDPFTKPPLFRRNRLTGSGNPSYRGTADQNWFSVVVVERSSGCTLQFTSAELLPLHNFQN